jgi:hypothetical protein
VEYQESSGVVKNNLGIFELKKIKSVKFQEILEF